MKVEFKKIIERDKFDRLFQLYLSELSLYYPAPYNYEECLNEYDNINRYFNDNNHYSYFIYLNNNIVGFVLIDDNSNDNYELSEIFILNQVKNQGIGTIVVNKIFDKYRGNWIIKVVPNSKKAENFWMKTIKEYTNNNFEVIYTGKYNRAEFSFNNKK